jgi:[ribosomal protein S18]-alanine N-acetyltransferase
MTPETMAAIHRRCFDGAPRPWSQDEFAALLDHPTTILVHCDEGFALGRIAGAEVELLTLAVVQEARGQGAGRRLLKAFEAAARARGGDTVYLEVAEANRVARALYGSGGYRPAGYRKDYYGPSGARSGALVLRKPLHEVAPGKSD